MREKELESWICEDVCRVAGPDARLLGRQVSLPSGRIPDVLVRTEGGIVVVEVKAKKAKPRAVLQLLEYMAEVDALTDEWQLSGPGNGHPARVGGLLIAPEFDPRTVRLLRVCDSLNLVKCNGDSVHRPLRPKFIEQLVNRASWVCSEPEIEPARFVSFVERVVTGSASSSR